MVNMWQKCIFSVILFPILASAEYDCSASGHSVSCTAIQEDNLYDNLTVALTTNESNELQELKIENSFISVVKGGMFLNFPNIQVLRLRNTSTQTVEEGAFEDLYNLTKIYLTDNYLQDFNSNTFASNNSIRILDLSHNLLNNLDSFDIELIPFLTIMNISHNKMEYLPEGVLNKLKEENHFYLIIDNNPWNCSHPKWIEQLTEILVEAFCNGKTFDPSEVNAKEANLVNLQYMNNTKSLTETENDNFFCIGYSLKNCLLWAFGGVWVGVILGNMCKLKRMLFTTPRRYEDKNTQCDTIDLLRKI
ncbi:leucine-rich repeat, immunoglobulin-like domain and transmembrane domain-containing protein 2 isoform X2 [Anoplophora glabripennis]|uniref:leucine-rich repeat, immunoglobulin-like domain and transmembrane domain-containing protein 2 isoform X2 n=1 Tax=Anoplophora glabripennis TaxID=217634 RepID=UPI0008746575|nr:leucine-rich repeat, immunoglobulin-like domain and transmembrane domain-containing protein 2 isoform X2 [Anoplophora glabripennis]